MAETRVARDIDHPDPTLKRRSEIFRPAFLLLQLHRHWQSLGVGISRQQFEQMKARLGDNRRGPFCRPPPATSARLSDAKTARLTTDHPRR